jgi:hypothetical protein
MKKNLTLIIWLVIAVVVLVFGIAYFRSTDDIEWLPGNPASINCVENGGKSETRSSPDGSQYGVCKFNDGTECEEWVYFRGTCKPGQYKRWEDRGSEACIGNLQIKPPGVKCCAGLRPDLNFEGKEVCAGGIVD